MEVTPLILGNLKAIHGDVYCVHHSETLGSTLLALFVYVTEAPATYLDYVQSCFDFYILNYCCNIKTINK